MATCRVSACMRSYVQPVFPTWAGSTSRLVFCMRQGGNVVVLLNIPELPPYLDNERARRQFPFIRTTRSKTSHSLERRKDHWWHQEWDKIWRSCVWVSRQRAPLQRYFIPNSGRFRYWQVIQLFYSIIPLVLFSRRGGEWYRKIDDSQSPSKTLRSHKRSNPHRWNGSQRSGSIQVETLDRSSRTGTCSFFHHHLQQHYLRSSKPRPSRSTAGVQSCEFFQLSRVHQFFSGQIWHNYRWIWIFNAFGWSETK